MSEAEVIDYFEDEGEDQAPPATLERLIELANKASTLETEINDANVSLAEKMDERNKIVRDLIPSVMEELGMAKFTMTDGSLIDVKEHINASIKEEFKAAAFKWLEEHEKDGIIKTKVLSEFGKGEMDDAKKALKAIEDAGFSGILDRSVHPMTLKSFVKEQLEEGINIPLDVFGVFQFKEAKITLPKTSKPKRK
jgi:hypothetical protein